MTSFHLTLKITQDHREVEIVAWTNLSLSSTSCMFTPFRSEASDVGVGGYSMEVFPPGRCIRRIQGNQ